MNPLRPIEAILDWFFLPASTRELAKLNRIVENLPDAIANKDAAELRRIGGLLIDFAPKYKQTIWGRGYFLTIIAHLLLKTP